MKKKLLTIAISFILVIAFTACSSAPPKESEMKTDIEEHMLNFFSETESIDKVEIIKRQTEKNKKLDIAWCKIESHDDEAEYVKYFTLYYKLYDKGGWILEDLEKDEKDKWTSTPLFGVSDEMIEDAVVGKNFKINGENWAISYSNLAEMSIVSQNTDLGAKKDSVVVNVTIDDAFEQANGELTIEYEFDNGWHISSISGERTFKTTLKPGCEFNVPEQEIIDRIVDEGIYLEDPKKWATAKPMSITESEISDFEIVRQASREKGCRQVVYIEATINKPAAIIDLDATATYVYENGKWELTQLDNLAEISSFALEGDWSGTYKEISYGGHVTLSINSVDNDGNIDAIYSYAPSQANRYSYPGSYKVSGKINKTTFRIDLYAGDWVDEPYDYSWVTKCDIHARLDMEALEIKGAGHEACTFVIHKS